MHRALLPVLLLAMLVVGCFGPGDTGNATDPTATADGTATKTDQTTGTTGPPRASWSRGPWDDGTCEAFAPAPGRAWTLDAENITSWRVGTNGLEAIGRAALTGQWLGHDGGLLVAGAQGVARLDEELRVVDTAPVSNVTAFWGSSDGVVLASGWDVVRLDRDLDELWRTDLNEAEWSSPGKSLDHMVVRDGRVFVVDDVVMPFYGFILDLESGGMRHEGSWSSSRSASFHAVTASSWLIDAGFYGQGGSGAWLERFDHDGQHLERLPTGSSSYDPVDGGARGSTGFRIHAMAPLGQAVLHNGSMAWATFGDDSITTHCGTGPPRGPSAALSANAGLAVAATPDEVVALWQGGHVQRVAGTGVEVRAVLVGP